MLKREEWEIGKKRVYRLYRLKGLQLRMKIKRRKRICLQRGRLMPATGPNPNWSMDFVYDQMLDGSALRVLTVIDQWSRESVTLKATSGSPAGASVRPWTRPRCSADGPRRSPYKTAQDTRPWHSINGPGAAV